MRGRESLDHFEEHDTKDKIPKRKRKQPGTVKVLLDSLKS